MRSTPEANQVLSPNGLLPSYNPARRGAGIRRCTRVRRTSNNASRSSKHLDRAYFVIPRYPRVFSTLLTREEFGVSVDYWKSATRPRIVRFPLAAKPT